MWEGCDLFADDDLVLWYKVITNQVGGHLRGISNDDVDFLQGQTDAVVVEMPLEPVIWIIPVTDEREILNLNYPASVLVCVLFHIVNLYSANLVKFVPVAILKQ